MKYSLQQEKAVLRELEKAYASASDELKDKIAKLVDEYGRTGLQSKIYQLKWQRTLKKQVDETLGRIRSGVYQSIEDYRTNCYENGFLGALYDMQGQGVPLIMPIDPEKVVKAVTLDSRLSKSLYDSLGINLDNVKKTVREEISRSLVMGQSYAETAMAIDRRIGTGKYNAYRIARTEGARITNEATYDALLEAKKNGADVVKEWCGILDDRIRPSHAELHGQVKEIDEYFEVNGHRALHPSGFKVASEDINCRCTLLQKARWALEAEGDGIIEADTFTEFKKKFKKMTEDSEEFEKIRTGYRKVKKIMGRNAPDLYSYFEIATGAMAGLFGDYVKRVEKKEILSTTTFDEFVNVLGSTEKAMTGLVTKDGVRINSVSLHFVARTIGNESDHVTVPIEYSIDALMNPMKIMEDKIDKDGNVSRKYKGLNAEVSLNPNTGKLIQCNIRNVKKKQ